MQICGIRRHCDNVRSCAVAKAAQGHQARILPDQADRKNDQVMVRDFMRVDQVFVLAMTVYNLVRMRFLGKYAYRRPERLNCVTITLKKHFKGVESGTRIPNYGKLSVKTEFVA